MKIEEGEKRKNSKVKDRVEEEEGKGEVGKVGGGGGGGGRTGRYSGLICCSNGRLYLVQRNLPWRAESSPPPHSSDLPISFK